MKTKTCEVKNRSEPGGKVVARFIRHDFESTDTIADIVAKLGEKACIDHIAYGYDLSCREKVKGLLAKAGASDDAKMAKAMDWCVQKAKSGDVSHITSMPDDAKAKREYLLGVWDTNLKPATGDDVPQYDLT